jgi:uncharacterized protein (DUF1800 family)
MGQGRDMVGSGLHEVVETAEGRRSHAALDVSMPPISPISRETLGVAAGLIASALPGCGGGALGPITPNDAARFLGRASLGATLADIDQLAQLGFGGWLDRQFAMPVSESLWNWAQTHGFQVDAYKASDMGMDQALWFRLLNSPDVLRQRVVLALSELFVVSVRNMPFPWGQFGCIAYWELLEAECFGNFRTLLERITLSPAMGVYLSMRGSRKEDAQGRQPDENFARELLQLFTIGLVQLNEDGSPKLGANGQPLDTFNNDDVRGLARVFTGWDFDNFEPATPDYMRRPMAFDASQHSVLDKTFLGTTIPGATPGKQALTKALDTVFAHPNVPFFIARQLIQRLVCSNPTPAYVARVAFAFKDNGQGVRGDMKAVLKAVLLDVDPRYLMSDMPSEAVGKLREPILRFTQWTRVVKLQSTDGLWNVGDLSAADRLGQSPLRAASVFNFFRPGYAPPHSALADEGLVAPEFQITDESTVIGYANFIYRVLPFGSAGVVPDYSDWLPLATDPAALVDRINLLFTGRTLSADTVASLVTALASINMADPQGPMRRVLSAMLIVLCCPEFLVQR